MKKRTRGFVQGYIYACAELVRANNKKAAKYLWEETGFLPKDVKCCSEYDLEDLRELIEDLPTGCNVSYPNLITL